MAIPWPPPLVPRGPRPPQDWGDPGLVLPRAGLGWHRVLAPVSRVGTPLALASGSPSCPGSPGTRGARFPHTGVNPWPLCLLCSPRPPAQTPVSAGPVPLTRSIPVGGWVRERCEPIGRLRGGLVEGFWAGVCNLTFGPGLQGSGFRSLGKPGGLGPGSKRRPLLGGRLVLKFSPLGAGVSNFVHPAPPAGPPGLCRPHRPFPGTVRGRPASWRSEFGSRAAFGSFGLRRTGTTNRWARG